MGQFTEVERTEKQIKHKTAIYELTNCIELNKIDRRMLILREKKFTFMCCKIYLISAGYRYVLACMPFLC